MARSERDIHVASTFLFAVGPENEIHQTSCFVVVPRLLAMKMIDSKDERRFCYERSYDQIPRDFLLRYSPSQSSCLKMTLLRNPYSIVEQADGLGYYMGFEQSDYRVLVYVVSPYFEDLGD